LGVYALIQGDLKQAFRVHLIRVVLHDQQMRFLIMVRHTHHPGVISDRVGDFNPAFMRYGFVDVNYYVSHVHEYLLLFFSQSQVFCLRRPRLNQYSPESVAG